MIILSREEFRAIKRHIKELEMELTQARANASHALAEQSRKSLNNMIDVAEHVLGAEKGTVPRIKEHPSPQEVVDSIIPPEETS